ncbi:Gfo/Idh/MocA family protein [Woodsholea maritima]|uniref:Gfo/Idh/MocA family protein n=1 Tax=Woodsholea maritima TaxID=240237 RepID=UPI0003658D1F|nr:Gfo/Idh/MocA family oxidoreductase [Woodsholea maritima]
MSDINLPQPHATRRGVLQAGLMGSAAIGLSTGARAQGNNPNTQGRMIDYAAPRLDKVRVGVIGTGRRGATHLRLLANIDGVEIKAICDVVPAAIASAQTILRDNGAPEAAVHTGSDEAYRELLARDDIDAVFVITPWRWHHPMAKAAMVAGKHAFVEVPVALSVEECWDLVETSEATGQHCMMLENVCYGRDELMALNMVRQNVLGELLHGEAAYIHELRWQMKDTEEGTGLWRTGWHARRNANLYPTHGLGPVSQYMGINRGDRFDYMTSMASPALGRQLYAQREFPADHERNQMRYICGDMNTSLIKTVRGRTIMVQHDTTTPRPYSRHNLIQGTGGVFAGFPNRIALEASGDFHHWDQDMEPYYAQYDHPLWTQVSGLAAQHGGHGGMDYVMLWRLVYCLRNGLPLDQNVYDAAAWSVINPLSEASLEDRSNSKDIPDFTRGAWQSAGEMMADVYAG